MIIGYSTDHATCQVCPSAYAYHKDFVSGTENNNANCRSYMGQHTQTARTEDYVYCNGTNLKLCDSLTGSAEHYNHQEYYEWTDETRNTQMLFKFSNTVNLIKITLHYYSDATRGLPQLRFWNVQNEFAIWESPPSSNSHVKVDEMRPDNLQPGKRNISITFVFNTSNVLIIKSGSDFQLAVSEVEFFTCSSEFQLLCVDHEMSL